jgi:hypothetical protein
MADAQRASYNAITLAISRKIMDDESLDREERKREV